MTILGSRAQYAVMDTFLFVFVVVGTVGAIVWISLRTRQMSHPVALIGLSFFLPMGAALLRLSELQAARWTYDTNVLLIEAYLLWLAFPCLALAILTQGPQHVPRDQSLALRLEGPGFRWYARSLAIATVVAILLQNYLTAGLPVVLLDPELAYEYHTSTVPVIQIMGRAGFAACALLHLAFYHRRKSIDLVLLVVVLLSPLTRLGRIDLMLSGLTLLLMNAYFPVVRLSRRTVTVAILGALAFIYGMVEVGNQRVSRFGRFSVSYADAIGFRGYAGPGETFAVAYGYFALSFENLDRFVRVSNGYRTHGLVSFSPVFNTLFFLNRLTAGKYPGPEIIVARRNPVGPMATVETCLASFYLDFGAGLAWVPMLIYMGVWIWLYLRRSRSLVFATVYCLYSAAMMLSAFQGVVTAPFIYQGILLAMLPLVLSNRVLLRAPKGKLAAGV